MYTVHINIVLVQVSSFYHYREKALPFQFKLYWIYIWGLMWFMQSMLASQYHSDSLPRSCMPYIFNKIFCIHWKLTWVKNSEGKPKIKLKTKCLCKPNASVISPQSTFKWSLFMYLVWKNQNQNGLCYANLHSEKCWVLHMFIICYCFKCTDFFFLVPYARIRYF